MHGNRVGFFWVLAILCVSVSTLWAVDPTPVPTASETLKPGAANGLLRVEAQVTGKLFLGDKLVASVIAGTPLVFDNLPTGPQTFRFESPGLLPFNRTKVLTDRARATLVFKGPNDAKTYVPLGHRLSKLEVYSDFEGTVFDGDTAIGSVVPYQTLSLNTLVEGTHILRLYYADGKNLYRQVTLDPLNTPVVRFSQQSLNVGKDGSILIPAGKYVAQGGFTVRIAKNYKDSKASVIYDWLSGSDEKSRTGYVEWRADVPVSGDYALAIRYANGISSSIHNSIYRGFTVDGGSPESAFESVDLSYTGGSGSDRRNDWANLWVKDDNGKVVYLHLDAGEHHIRMVDKGFQALATSNNNLTLDCMALLPEGVDLGVLGPVAMGWLNMR